MQTCVQWAVALHIVVPVVVALLSFGWSTLSIRRILFHVGLVHCGRAPSEPGWHLRGWHMIRYLHVRRTDRCWCVRCIDLRSTASPC